MCLAVFCAKSGMSSGEGIRCQEASAAWLLGDTYV